MVDDVSRTLACSSYTSAVAVLLDGEEDYISDGVRLLIPVSICLISRNSDQLELESLSRAAEEIIWMASARVSGSNAA